MRDQSVGGPQTLLQGQTIVESVPATEPELVHIAASYAGRLLTDLGAKVVRIVPLSDPLLHLKSAAVETVGESSVLATYLNRGKRLLSADQFDVSHESERADLVLSGSTQAMPAAAGVPIVHVSAGYQEGNGVSELSIQGLVGLTDLFGEPDQQPLMMGGHQTAYATGYAVFCAAMASLVKRKLHGDADTAHVSAVDALAWVNWKGVAAGALGFPVVRGGKGAEAPVLECADGHFAFMHLPKNWEDIQAEVNDPRLGEDMFAGAGRRAKHAHALNEIFAEWVADKSWRSLYEFFQRCAIPGGPILRGVDLLEDPLYLHRNFFDTVQHQLDGETVELQVPGLPMTVEGVAEHHTNTPVSSASFSENTPSNLPLSGKLVLDLGIFTAGSVTSTLLADLGATVIKVESESYSDPFRIWPGIKGDSPLFTFNNRNKLGLNLDLKSDQGRTQFLELVAQADVVVENFRRGVLERLGIDYPVLKAANPRIVLASISGQGASGPGSRHVSFGSTLEAIGGVAALTGYPGAGCYISGRNLNYPDQIVCLYGAGAVMAALMKVDETGCGLHVDVSQREVTTLAVGEVVAAASLFGNQPDFPGNKNMNTFLQDIFAVADGWLCVTIASRDQGDVLTDKLECDIEALEQSLSAWLEKQDSVTACKQLRELGIIACKANTGAEAAEETAINSGSAFAKTKAGTMVKGFPFQFANNPLIIYEESPAMGEHTQHILDVLQAGK